MTGMAIAAALVQAAPVPPPQTPAEWGAVAVIAAFAGKLVYDVVMRLLPTKPPEPPKAAAPAPAAGAEVLACLQRLEAKMHDVRDRVHRLDDQHAVRGATGEPVWYCGARALERQLEQVLANQARLEDVVGRLLEHQRQGNGILSKLVRRLREHLDGR